MKLDWLRDYGAFVAASVAAVVALMNGVLQARRDRSARDSDWLRVNRMPRYAAFVDAALGYRRALHEALGEWEPDLGPPSTEKLDVGVARSAFSLALAEVQLVGPAKVSTAARRVQFSMWRYSSQLERDPFDYDQTVSSAEVTRFIEECRSALAVPQSDGPEIEYREWLRSLES